MTEELSIQDQIKVNQKLIIRKQRELNTLQMTQNDLYLEQQLEDLGE